MTGRRSARGPRHARWQSALAVVAIAVAVALPVVLVGVGGGVAAHELASLENTGYQIVVSAAGLHGIEYAHVDMAKMLAIPGVADAAPILSIAIDLFNATGVATPVLAEGVVPTEFLPTLGPTERDLFPSPLPLRDPNDTEHYANGTYNGTADCDVLVSSSYAAAARVAVGSTIVLSPTTNESAGVRYNVTGLYGIPFSLGEPNGAFAAIVLLSNLQTLTGYAAGPHAVVPDGADTIEVVVAPADATDPAALAAIARAVHAVVPSYSVTTLSSEASQLRSAAGVLTGFYLALSSVGLGVGLLFLGVVLVRRVERERRSIGIRRALGEPTGAIAREIVGNAALLAVAGAAGGIVSGIVLVRALATWASATVQAAAQLAVFAPTFLGELAAAVVALAAVASLAAVRAAARLELAEALR